MGGAIKDVSFCWAYAMVMSPHDSSGSPKCILLSAANSLMLNLQYDFHCCSFEREFLICDKLLMSSGCLSDFHVKLLVAPSLVCNSKLKNITILTNC